MVNLKMCIINFDFFFFSLDPFLQVYLCFQRVAAEILGVKLNKAEIEQSQVHFFSLSASKVKKGKLATFTDEPQLCILCNPIPELCRGHVECVRSLEVTTHCKGPSVV